MNLNRKILIGVGALALAVVGITGVLAAGRAHGNGAACPKLDCKQACPKDCPKDCPPCPACPGC